MCKTVGKSLSSLTKIEKMRYIHWFVAVLVVVFSSCSSDDSASTDKNPVDNSGVTSYFPLKSNNYWTYKTENVSVNPIAIGRDSIYVGNDSIINSITYKRMKTKSLPTGFFCGALRNNGLRVDGKMVKLSGDVSVNIGVSLPVAFSVTDFVIFKENATTLEKLATVSGTVINETALPGYPLTVSYTLSAKEDGSLPTLTSDGKEYSDIKKVKLILNLKVTAQVGEFSINVLSSDNQDVLVSNQYYAKNQGLVKSETNINYSLNPLIGELTTVDFPLSSSQTTNDYLLTKLIN